VLRVTGAAADSDTDGQAGCTSRGDTHQVAPAGCLIISECVRPYLDQPMYPELVFQILDSFTDVDTDSEFRPNPGFLTADHWRRAFSRAGFEHTEVKPELDGIREIYPHFFTGAICGQQKA